MHQSIETQAPRAPEHSGGILTRRTERRIRKVMGGVKKKNTQGRVTKKINCANPKDNHGLKFITKGNVLLTAILACLIRLQLSKHLPCFESLDI